MKFAEVRVTALVILVLQYQRGDEKTRARIYAQYLANTRHINNWDLVDSSAHHVVGAHLWQRPREPLYELARSASLWERRVAIIATLHHAALRHREVPGAEAKGLPAGRDLSPRHTRE